MQELQDFRKKDFFEQITILNQITEDKDVTALPQLLDLYRNPVGDTSVDHLVLSALNKVLSASEEETAKGLASDQDDFRILCIRMAGEKRFAACAPILADMVGKEEDSDIRFDILTSLARIKDESSVGVFLEYARSDDPYEAAMSIEILGDMGSQEAVDALAGIITANEDDDAFEVCEITTWKAIDALAAIGGDKALSALTQRLHHRNPTARRIITDALVRVGEEAVIHLGEAFGSGDVDQRILAANVIGFIGHKSGANILVQEMDRGGVDEPNVLYALYEALGRIGTMKGIICLMDALDEADEFILMAVVGGLDRHVNSGMVEGLGTRLAREDEPSARLVRAIVAAGAVNLFQPLHADEAVAARLVAEVAASKDPEILAVFRETLVGMGTKRAKADLASLPEAAGALTGRILAVDDSKSMLALYRSIITSMGFEPVVAVNGQEALELVQASDDFDLVVTDMNMPVMDGMELVSRLRGMEGHADTPVIMVTTESEASQRSLAEKCGVDTFLSKPFKPDEFKSLVAKVLGG